MKILITGAGSGIGLACKQYYKNHDILAIDKDDLDLSNLNSVEQFAKKNNNFDAFIHCAGIREIEEPTELSIDTWQKVMHVNLTASFILSQALIQKAQQNHKKLGIVNIASVSGLQAEPDRAAYVASKFALIGLTKQLAYQYGSVGIRVNAVAPGIIETPMTASYFNNPDLSKKIKLAIPVGHWGQVDNIVPLVDMCLSNDYLNGSVLVCDGGWTVGRSL